MNKIWDTLPKNPLPDRENLIMSKTLKDNDNYKAFNCYDNIFKYKK